MSASLASPFDELPDELVLAIFQHVRATTESDETHLLFVCRRFRRLYADRVLWTDTFPPRFRDNWFAGSWVRRTPITHNVLYLDTALMLIAAAWPAPATTPPPPLRLGVGFEKGDAAVLARAERIYPGVAYRLLGHIVEYAEFERIDDENEVMELWLALRGPVLRCVGIWNCAVPDGRLPLDHLPGLRELVIRVPLLARSFVKQLIADSTLERLIAGPTFDDDGSNHGLPIDVTNALLPEHALTAGGLRQLVLKDHTLFTFENVPRLETLDLMLHHPALSDMFDGLAVLPPRLRHLRIDLFVTAENIWPTLEILLAHAQLETLTFCVAIEEHLVSEFAALTLPPLWAVAQYPCEILPEGISLSILVRFELGTDDSGARFGKSGSEVLEYQFRRDSLPRTRP